VRELAKQVDKILVIGSVNSSNSNRLRDLGEEIGITSYLIDDEGSIKPEWLEGISSIGVTAGASAPETLVERVLKQLQLLRPATVRILDGVTENTRFKLPPEVVDKPFVVGKRAS
jgi:4-hydroxy-3-methylbut-2-enyl diphosphate reductase